MRLLWNRRRNVVRHLHFNTNSNRSLFFITKVSRYSLFVVFSDGQFVVLICLIKYTVCEADSWFIHSGRQPLYLRTPWTRTCSTSMSTFSIGKTHVRKFYLQLNLCPPRIEGYLNEFVHSNSALIPVGL